MKLSSSSMRLPFLTVRHLPLRVICEYNTEFVLLLAGFPSREDVEMHVLRIVLSIVLYLLFRCVLVAVVVVVF